MSTESSTSLSGTSATESMDDVGVVKVVALFLKETKVNENKCVSFSGVLPELDIMLVFRKMFHPKIQQFIQ